MAKTNTVSAEISITQKLKQLYELQLIDSEVDSIQIVKVSYQWSSLIWRMK